MARDMRTGTTLYYIPKRAIIGSSMLDDGTLIIFDGSLFAIKIINNEIKEIVDSLLEIPNAQEIATRGSQVLVVNHTGKLISFKFDGSKFLKEYSFQNSGRDQIVIKSGYVEDKILFFYTTDLDTLEFHITKDLSTNHYETIDSIEINGLLSLTGSLVIRSEIQLSFLCYNHDIIVRLDWDCLTRSFKQTCYKLKTRSGPSRITLIIPGEEYTINDYDCSSVIIFTDSSEILLGIFIEETIKFWTLSHDIGFVNHANYSKELGSLFIHSTIKSGIYSIDAKNLKLNLIEIFDYHNVSHDIQLSQHGNHQSLVCLSMDKNQLCSLDYGIKSKIKFSSDSIFRGVSNIWAIKTHQQDAFHEYLILSAKSYTLAFKYCDSIMTDITNILGINREVETKCAFNLKNSGYFVQVTAKNIFIFDVSKIDTVDNEAMKFKFDNTGANWNLVRHHENYLLCFSSASKTLRVFNLKNRPREIELVVPVNILSLDSMEIQSEVSILQLLVTEAGYTIFIGTIDGTILGLQFDQESKLVSSRSFHLNETIEEMSILSSSPKQELVLSSRCGNVYLCNIIESKCSLIANISTGPLRMTNISSESLVFYNSNSAAIVSFNGCDFNQKLFSNWNLDPVVEFSIGFGKSYLAGISGDSLVFIAAPKVSNQALSKHIIAHNTHISSFLPLKSDKTIISCFEGQDNHSFIKYYDAKWTELWSVDHGYDEILFVLSVEENDNFVVVVSKIKDKMQSKFELIEVETSKLSIKNEYLVDDMIKNAKFHEGILYFSANEDIFAFKICPITFRFLNRAAYHFRNNVLDFDVFRGQILISSFSDGLDILLISQDFEGNIKLVPSKGDKLSRTCLSCKWIRSNQFIAADTRKLIHLCEINETSRWIYNRKSIKSDELIIRILSVNERIYCETISGSILDISNEFK